MRCLGFFMKQIVDRRGEAQCEVTKRYIITFDRVIQPNLDSIIRTGEMKDVAPMMKSPYELRMFLLFLEVFNMNGDLSVKFVFVSSNVNLQIIALLIHEN